MATKKMGLGRGLGALLPEPELDSSRALLICGIEEIHPNRSQPRKHFDESKLQELTDSIREKGILEPLIVRKGTDGYELVVGERRWRAAQRAGLKEVPVLVRDLDDREVLELSLIENLQRDDLNSIEEAEAYQRLTDEFGLSQEQLGTRLGKDRSTVANTLRLLKLPLEIREHLLLNRITPGHARAILSLESPEKQRELGRHIIQKGLSVREAESLVRQQLKRPGKTAASGKKARDLESQLADLGDSLRRHLGTKIRIKPKGKKGKIEIEYYSFEDLERIVDTILNP